MLELTLLYDRQTASPYSIAGRSDRKPQKDTRNTPQRFIMEEVEVRVLHSTIEKFPAEFTNLCILDCMA